MTPRKHPAPATRPDSGGHPPSATLAGTTDPAELAYALMQIDSTSGSETEIVEFTHDLLAARGWQLRRIPVSPGRDDLLAFPDSGPVLTLSTHLDTVPPFIPPRLNEAEGRLEGRGACDAKGIAAAMIVAAEKLRDEDMPVGLLLVVGEETTHDGAHAANHAVKSGALPATSRVLINGEPTQSQLARGTKGALRFTLRTSGHAAHSAYPELGVSATMALVKLLAELDELVLPAHEVLGATTINIGHLSGGVADNVIAPWAEARCMARLVTPASDLLEILRDWLGDRAELTPGITVPPTLLGTVDGFATGVMAYATDIPALGAWGRPFLYGPGAIHVAHTDDEAVDLAELRESVDAYAQLARQALATWNG